MSFQLFFNCVSIIVYMQIHVSKLIKYKNSIHVCVEALCVCVFLGGGGGMLGTPTYIRVIRYLYIIFNSW